MRWSWVTIKKYLTFNFIKVILLTEFNFLLGTHMKHIAKSSQYPISLTQTAKFAIAFNATTLTFAMAQALRGDINSANNTLAALFVINIALLAAAVSEQAKR